MTFFTIDGVENDIPPGHPEVIKYFDRQSAEGSMNIFKKFGLIPDESFVAEHDVSVLQ